MSTARWSVVIVADDLSRDEKERLFTTVCDAVTALPFADGLDVSGRPLDEVEAMARDYGK